MMSVSFTEQLAGPHSDALVAMCLRRGKGTGDVGDSVAHTHLRTCAVGRSSKAESY